MAVPRFGAPRRRHRQAGRVAGVCRGDEPGLVAQERLRPGRRASDPLNFIGEPQSLLIDGRGMFNCSSLASRCSLMESPNIIAEPSHSQFVQWKHEVVLGISSKLSIL